jgi:hypothetical protein
LSPADRHPPAPLRRLIADRRASVAFEAVWVVLLLSTLLMVGLFLFQIVKTGGSGPIDNRTAGRSAALNRICVPGGMIPGLMQTIGTRDDSIISIRCDPNVDGETRLAQDQKFFPALQRIGNARFANFNREQEGAGAISVVLSEQETRFLTRFSIQDYLLASNLTYANEALTPMADTWRFDVQAWAVGHDRVIWDRLTPRHRELLPRVYPSAQVQTQRQTPPTLRPFDPPPPLPRPGW